MRENATLARQAEQLAGRLIDRRVAAILDLEDQVREPRALLGRGTVPAALAVMGPVLLVGPAAALAGIALLLQGGFGSSLAGGLLVLLGYLSHPRREARPEPTAVLGPGQAPLTFAFMRTVADALDAPEVEELAITAGSGSRIDVLGLRRRRTLTLGVPLWVGMEPDARVALVAHELAHLSRRELVVVRLGRRALATLDEWWQLFGGQHSIVDVKPDSEWNALSWSLRLVWSPLRVATGWYHRLLVTRLAPLCAAGELLADQDSLALAGPAGTMSMLDAHLGAGTVEVALSRARLARRDLEDELRSAKAVVPQHVIASRRGRAATQGSRVDPLHPATALRQRQLSRGSVDSRTVSLSAGASAQVDDELRPWVRMALKESAERMTYTRDGVRERRAMPPGWTYELWG